MIAVAASGENSIVTAAGANSMLDRSMVRGQRELIEKAGILLCQWEIPTTVLIEAIKIANDVDIPVLFNPSPVRSDFPWGRLNIDTLIVNEHEARSLFGSSIRLDSPREWEPVLRSHGLKRVVVTRGCRSTICISDDARLEIPVMAIGRVDHRGGWGCFCRDTRRMVGWPGGFCRRTRCGELRWRARHSQTGCSGGNSDAPVNATRHETSRGCLRRNSQPGRSGHGSACNQRDRKHQSRGGISNGRKGVQQQVERILSQFPDWLGNGSQRW